ncbi:MAG: hypothetical protein VXW22_04390 [Pseudomonadota bacterium]|nr:hypothetical protein [Pseudomonadota bacterium]
MFDLKWKLLAAAASIVVFLTSCARPNAAFRLCSADNPHEFVELDLSDGVFASSDYIGRIEYCTGDRTCIEKPLVFSVPPFDIEDIDGGKSWSDGGYDFRVEKTDAGQFTISVSAPWGDEVYDYSNKLGITNRAVEVPSGRTEQWNVCGGRLRFSDFESSFPNRQGN